MTTAPLKAQPGTKFILVFTLPSGTKMAAGGVKDKFALMPIPEDGKLQDVLAWDDTRQVALWMKEFKKMVGGEEWKKWAALSPSLGRITIVN